MLCLSTPYRVGRWVQPHDVSPFTIGNVLVTDQYADVAVVLSSAMSVVFDGKSAAVISGTRTDCLTAPMSWSTVTSRTWLHRIHYEWKESYKPQISCVIDTTARILGGDTSQVLTTAKNARSPCRTTSSSAASAASRLAIGAEEIDCERWKMFDYSNISYKPMWQCSPCCRPLLSC